MADEADFTLRLVDKFSGNAKGAGRSGRELAGELAKIEDKSVNVTTKVTRMDRAVGGVKFAAYGAQAAFYGAKLLGNQDALAGLHKVAGAVKPRMQALTRSVATGARRIAPFAIGGAGLLGLGKIASSITLPALGGMAIGLGAVATAAGVATVAVGALLLKVASAGKEFVTFGQNQRLAFNQLAKHGASGARLFDHARGLAEEFGLDVKDTSKQYAKFLALQFNPRQADKLIKLGADMRVLGNSAEDVQGIFLALGQIKSKGRLQGEELLQLQERAVSGELIKEAIAEQMGIAVSEVDKQISAGKVTSDIALPAIETALLNKLGTKEAGEAGKRFAETTIDGAVGRVKARGQNLALTLAERFEAPATRFMNKAADKIFGFLESPKGQETIATIGRGIEKLGIGLEKSLPFVEAFVAGFGGGFGSAFTAALDVVGPLFEKLGGSDGQATKKLFEQLGKSFGFAAFGMVALAGATVSLVAGMGAVTAAGMQLADTIGTTIGGALSRITEAFRPITDILNNQSLTLGEKALAIGRAIVTGIGNGIKNAAGLALEAIGGLGDQLVAKLSGVLQIQSPSRVFARLGAQTAAGFSMGLTAQSDSFMRGINLGPMVRGVGNMAAANDVGGLGGGGPIRVTFGDIHIHGGSDPRETADLARRAIREEVEAVLTSLALEVA